MARYAAACRHIIARSKRATLCGTANIEPVDVGAHVLKAGEQERVGIGPSPPSGRSASDPCCEVLRQMDGRAAARTNQRKRRGRAFYAKHGGERQIASVRGPMRCGVNARLGDKRSGLTIQV